MKFSKKIKHFGEWYRHNKTSAISTIAGSVALLAAIISTYNGINYKKEILRIQQNPYVTQYINTDVQLKELKDELRCNNTYYLIHKDRKEYAKKIEDSLEHKLNELEKNNVIVQEYDEKAKPSKNSSNNISGFYHYHSGSKKSSANSGIAFASYILAGFGYLLGSLSKACKK